MNRFQIKTKNVLYAYPVKQPYYPFVNWFCFFCIKCISSTVYFSIYVYEMHVCKKQINKIKKRSTDPYQFLHFLTIFFVSLLNNFVEGIRSKKKTCRFGTRMMWSLNDHCLSSGLSLSPLIVLCARGML